jgi:hypothetical protein
MEKKIDPKKAETYGVFLALFLAAIMFVLSIPCYIGQAERCAPLDFFMIAIAIIDILIALSVKSYWGPLSDISTMVLSGYAYLFSDLGGYLFYLCLLILAVFGWLQILMFSFKEKPTSGYREYFSVSIKYCLFLYAFTLIT